MQYAPGEILNETTLAEEFGTSRGPLREVLKQLEWKKQRRYQLYQDRFFIPGYFV